MADARGIISFNLLQRRARWASVCLGFDVLELDGQDLCSLPLERRKGELKILLKRAPFGLSLND